MKLVLDTNTLISGAFWQGPPARILKAAAQKKVELILTADLLAEFADVAARPRFAKCLVEGRTLEMPAELRDLKDLPVLACAVAATLGFGDI